MKDNKQASREQAKLFDTNMMGIVMQAIYLHHRDKDTLYELSREAEEVYEEICEKYNDQFNLKWSGMLKYSKKILNILNFFTLHISAHILLAIHVYCDIRFAGTT